MKLTDFGLCRFLEENEFSNSFCGTPGYIAPEIYKRDDYNYTCDWWSFGIFIYELLTNGTMWHLCETNDDGSFDDYSLRQVFCLKMKYFLSTFLARFLFVYILARFFCLHVCVVLFCRHFCLDFFFYIFSQIFLSTFLPRFFPRFFVIFFLVPKTFF